MNKRNRTKENQKENKYEWLPSGNHMLSMAGVYDENRDTARDKTGEVSK